jgi:hypothetical protein
LRAGGDAAIGAEGDGARIGGNDGRMGGGRPHRRTPFLARPVIGAAIDHEPVAPIAHFEGEQLRMGVAVEARRRRLAAIE